MFQQKMTSSLGRLFSTSARLQKTEDLITSAYLNQLRDLISKQKAAGGTLVNSSPEIKKQLDEQLNRLAQKFKLASSDVVGKLHVEFEKVALQSSVAAVTEGRSIDDLLKQVKKSQAEYEKERAAKKQEEAKRLALLNAASSPDASSKSVAA